LRFELRKYSPVLVALVCGCELDKTAIPRTTPQLALHGVLSGSAQTQVVLLERTNSGRVDIIAPSFDLEDPIGSDAGIAETGALMTLTTPDGGTLVAHEDNNGGPGAGHGVYRFALAGSSLQRNATYRLTVVTTAGEQLSAETSVPDGATAMSAALGSFDRSSATLMLDWPASPTARSYFVRVETPFGPRSFFTESTHVQLPGMLRNADLDDLPHVFIPGFAQAVTVSAVDSNYYDWYRTHNDPLSGEGLISRVSGGLGVFGSLVRLRYDSVQVTAPQTEAIEGRFQLDQSTIPALGAQFTEFNIWVESPGSRSGQADALSGQYWPRPRLGYVGCLPCGMLGSAHNGQLELVLLSAWSAADTTEVFDGTLKGDTITGNFRIGGGPFKFVRQ
jgi:hypothetical protein